MRSLLFAGAMIVSGLSCGSGGAAAATYPAYPAPTPYYPFQRSFPTGRLVTIPPYEHVFVERVYTTPPEQPYYNVPPYRVIAPY